MRAGDHHDGNIPDDVERSVFGMERDSEYTGWFWQCAMFMRQPGDTVDDVRSKGLFAMGYALWSISPALAMTNPVNDGGYWFYTSLFALLVSLSALFSLLYFRKINNIVLTITIIGTVLAICSRDIAFVLRGERSWPAIVLLLDMLLVVNAQQKAVIAVVVVMGAWILFIEAELTWRFGLFDVPVGLESYEVRRERQCCEKPPCATEDPRMQFMMGLQRIFTFVIDFVLTRQFAEAVKKEKRSIEESSRVVELVASCLASYDLDKADQYLTAHRATLPRELMMPLVKLLENLRVYRSYLPHAVLGGDPPRARPPRAPARRRENNPLTHLPGCKGDDAHAGVVVASVREAGAMWEHCSSAMHSALSTYSTIIRTTLYTHKGHEVTSSGDYYTVAFHKVADAVQFAAEVLEKVSEQRWPVELGRPNMGDGFPLVGIQLGVDYGPVVVERSTLTGLAEYFGPTVDCAALASQVGVAGSVTVTSCVLAELPDEVMNGLLNVGSVSSSAGNIELHVLLPVVLGDQETFICDRAMEAQDENEMKSIRSSAVDAMEQNLLPDLLSPESFMNYANPHMMSGNITTNTARQAATIGAVRYSSWDGVERFAWDLVEQNLTTQLQALHTHLEETHGHVSTVLNDIVVVSWGIHGECAQHANESTRFMLRLYDERVPFHSGLATGPVALGVVTPTVTNPQRHVTLLGPTVSVALALCVEAAEARGPALFASLQVGGYEDRRPHLRAVGWTLWLPLSSPDVPDNEDGIAVAVYELNLGSAAAAAAAGSVVDNNAELLDDRRQTAVSVFRRRSKNTVQTSPELSNVHVIR